MATIGQFQNGAGQIIQFAVEMRSASIVVTFDDANKDLQCNIYGQLIAQPNDPVGQQNLVNALANAIVQEAQANGFLPLAQLYLLNPQNAIDLAAREVTSGEIRKACSWGEAFDPDTG